MQSILVSTLTHTRASSKILSAATLRSAAIQATQHISIYFRFISWNVCLRSFFFIQNSIQNIIDFHGKNSNFWHDSFRHPIFHFFSFHFIRIGFFLMVRYFPLKLVNPRDLYELKRWEIEEHNHCHCHHHSMQNIRSRLNM